MSRLHELGERLVLLGIIAIVALNAAAVAYRCAHLAEGLESDKNLPRSVVSDDE